MSIKKGLTYIAGALAVLATILGAIARGFFATKTLFGLSALSYLRIADTLLLFTIVFLLLEAKERRG